MRSHLREVRRGDAAEAELEAAGLSEVALRGQADRLARRGDQPVPVEHLSPAVRHGGRVFRFHHDFKSQREWEKKRKAPRSSRRKCHGGCCGPVEIFHASGRHVGFRSDYELRRGCAA